MQSLISTVLAISVLQITLSNFKNKTAMAHCKFAITSNSFPKSINQPISDFFRVD